MTAIAAADALVYWFGQTKTYLTANFPGGHVGHNPGPS